MDHPESGWLAVGYVRRPHGVQGEVAVTIETDFPERVVPGVTVGVGSAAPERFIEVHRVRLHKGAWLLSFVGFRSRDDVEPLRDCWLFLPAQKRSDLPQDYYYEHELAGLSCVRVDGTRLGEVVSLEQLGGGSLLLVNADGREVLVPFASPIVVRVDLDAHVVVLDPPRGLFDGDAL